MGLLRIERICDLPDDLLLRILLLLPPKDAVATGILSKRWRFVWKMLHKLAFKDNDQGSESFVWFVDKTLQHHNAPKLVSLVVELGPRCPPVDVDVRKWVDKAVNHGVKKLDFNLLWTTGEPTSLPERLYTCDSLVSLTLSNQILVDVSFPASLPSLSYLKLAYVVYKDEESLARLLSSSPVLKQLVVRRPDKDDNLTNFTVKVPSLKILTYVTSKEEEEEEGKEEEEEVEVEVEEEEEEQEEEEEEEQEEEYHTGSLLVIDCPGLKILEIADYRRRDYVSLMNNFLCIDIVACSFIAHHDDEKFLRCLSSAIRLNLSLTESMVACCKTIEFPRITDFILNAEFPVYWLEPLMCLLQKFSKLKTLAVLTTGCPPCSWNQPSNIPQCLSSHLEIVQLIEYEGKEDEKQLMKYILANSKCLKTVEVSFLETCHLKELQMELEAMPRISASARLVYSCTPKVCWSYKRDTYDYIY